MGLAFGTFYQYAIASAMFSLYFLVRVSRSKAFFPAWQIVREPHSNLPVTQTQNSRGRNPPTTTYRTSYTHSMYGTILSLNAVNTYQALYANTTKLQNNYTAKHGKPPTVPHRPIPLTTPRFSFVFLFPPCNSTRILNQR